MLWKGEDSLCFISLILSVMMIFYGVLSCKNEIRVCMCFEEELEDEMNLEAVINDAEDKITEAVEQRNTAKIMSLGVYPPLEDDITTPVSTMRTPTIECHWKEDTADDIVVVVEENGKSKEWSP